MSEEREMLRQSVAALLAKHAGPAAVRAAMESERGYDESLWRLLCEQVGAAALVIPEELGGAGGELADAAAVLQELGRALVPSPLLGTTLAELALLAAPEPDTDTLERLAAGDSIGAVALDADYVVNGDIADVVVAAADGAGHGQPVVVLQRGDVLGHRRHDVDTPAFQGVAQQFVVAHLGGGHAGHRDASPQVGSHPRLIGQPVERGDLTVGQYREQFVDAGVIRRNPRRRRLVHRVGRRGWGGRSHGNTLVGGRGRKRAPAVERLSCL